MQYSALSFLKTARVCRYVLLYFLISFLGWLWETLYMAIAFGGFYDRGFLSLPFCPIYATCIFAVYFLLGTPQEGKGILKNVRKTPRRILFYAFFSFLLPTAAELAFGAFFDRILGVPLWTYRHYPYNFYGYICLPVSLSWPIMLLTFMHFIFPSLKKLTFALPQKTCIPLALALTLAVLTDFFIQLSAL